MIGMVRLWSVWHCGTVAPKGLKEVRRKSGRERMYVLGVDRWSSTYVATPEFVLLFFHMDAIGWSYPLSLSSRSRITVTVACR